jgi:hypothetical protein
MAHRWLRSSEYSGGGGSTYVEWPTRQAMWGVRELTNEAAQCEGGAPVRRGSAWRRRQTLVDNSGRRQLMEHRRGKASKEEQKKKGRKS